MPYKDPDKARLCQRIAARAYRKRTAAERREDAEKREAWLTKRRADALRYKARRRRSMRCHPTARAAAFKMRLHCLAPDGDIEALARRIASDPFFKPVHTED